MQKLVICVAPVGMWGKGDKNPITPEEIAEETYWSDLFTDPNIVRITNIVEE